MVGITQILSFFGNYTPLVSFLGAIIGGEETLLLLAILAAHNFFNIWIVIVFFYIGIVVSDTIWYALGKSNLFDWFVKKKVISKVYLHWDRLLNKATKRNDFQALLLTKFLYGFRVPTIMYLSRERLKFEHFLRYTAIVDLIWVSVIALISWFAGKGISFATNLSKNLVLSLVLIGIFMVLFTIIIRIISEATKKWLTQKQKQ